MWKYKMAYGLETCSHSSEFQFPSRTGPSLGRAVLQPAWYIGQRCGSLPAGPSPRVPPRWPRGCAKTQIQAILLGLWRETFPASLSRAVQGDPSPQLTADGKWQGVRGEGSVLWLQVKPAWHWCLKGHSHSAVSSLGIAETQSKRNLKVVLMT